MNGLFKSALRRCVIGFALGLVVSTVTLFMAGSGAFAGEAGAFAIRLLPGGVYGAVVMSCSVVYDVERWSIARATLIHFVVTLSGMYALGLAQEWLKVSLPGFVALTLGCVAIYILIWLFQWLSLRNKVQQINRGVKDCKIGGLSSSDIDGSR